MHTRVCSIHVQTWMTHTQTAHANIATRVCMHGAHARSHALRRSQTPPHTQAAAGVTFPSRSPGALRAWRCPGASDVAGEPAERGNCPGLGKEPAPLRETRRPGRRARDAGSGVQGTEHATCREGGDSARPPGGARARPGLALLTHGPHTPHARASRPELLPREVAAAPTPPARRAVSPQPRDAGRGGSRRIWATP